MNAVRRVTTTGASLLASALTVALATSAPASSAPAAAAESAPCAITAAQGAAPNTRPLDHAPVSDAEVRRVQQTLDSAKTQRRAAGLPATVHIPVYAHVLRSTNAARPVVSNWQIKKSVDVLNEAYPTRFEFDIVPSPGDPTNNAYDDTTNTAWYWATPDPRTGEPSLEERDMKEALHQGGAGDLNIYFVNQTKSTGLLGWATFPQDYEFDPLLDGVAINVNAVPRGAYADYNGGDTATHEVGHWLGLYHPFQGGCSAPGDGVTDTPRERTPTTGCPKNKNTCPAGAKDPIHNFMDYSYDACMYQFTSGQSDRMNAAWATYRAP